MYNDEEATLQLINEFKTRKEIIDPQLRNQGWDFRYIKEEVNATKSDIKRGNYVLFNGTVERGEIYIDYLLLNDDNTPLAIIEAKRYDVDPEKGRIQARTYAKEIESQTGLKIPIFMTNGEVWKFIDEYGRERKVSGPFSQQDLKRRQELYKSRKNPRQVPHDTKIVDRVKSIQIVRKLSEHFEEGYRKALVVMATGTGKTRVAMAIIKILMDANMVRNVLFIADRTALVNQAKANGFDAYFSEPVSDIREEISTTSRLYVSTVQTLVRDKKYAKFSLGFFDIIIFDEAHRSYYDRQNVVQQYFDAIQIGLTATPRDEIDRDTYKLFDCEKSPTVEYDYEEAVQDGVLAPYRAEIIETEVLSLGIEGSTLSDDIKDKIRRQEEDPDLLELNGSEFDRVFMDNLTNKLIITEFMNLCYKSDEGKPSKSIFFCASQRHAEKVKEIFNELYPSIAADVQVIISKQSRAQDEVNRFKKNSEPRIAISVGMLDTGIDVPEVCNLVFIKPVFSKVRFWQMLGRGTRNQKACRHKDWLPNREKKDFLILDFAIGGYSNVKAHNLQASEQKGGRSKGAQQRIFENRVNLLKEDLSAEQKELVLNKIMESIDQLDERDFFTRERLSLINKLKENRFDLDRYMDDLLNQIAPLMMFMPGTNPHITSFVLEAESLFKLVLDRNYEEIQKIGDNIQLKVANLLQQSNLKAIQDNKQNLIRVLQPKFWTDLTFADIEFLVKTISPLMMYYVPEGGKIIQVDAPDIVLAREEFEMEVKEDPKLKEFIETNPLIQKIKNGEPLTSKELKEIERNLNALKSEITIENIQTHKKKDFIVFLKELIGLSDDRNPREIIEQKFDEFIIDTHNYNSRQIEFLILLKKVLAERKYLEKRDLASEPFVEERPWDLFQEEELTRIIQECQELPVII